MPGNPLSTALVTQSVDPRSLANFRGDATNLARQSVNNLARQISGVDTTTWMGPLQPVSPFAPAGVSVRTWDYPVGINIRYTPRGEDPDALIGFPELRFFSRNVDLVRILIENRKEQLRRQRWRFHVKAESPEEGEQHKDDPRCKYLNQFWENPDHVADVDFPSWSGMMLDDMMVCDAPAIFLQRDRSGAPHSFRHIDGATMKLLVDETGGRPQPPSPAFQQIIHGVPTTELDTSQMIYYPRNPRPDGLYGYSSVEQIITTLNLMMRREIARFQWYSEANVPMGLIEVPAGFNTQQMKEQQEWLDTQMTGNTAARSHLAFVPSGIKYTDLKAPELTDKLDEWVAQVICYCFGVSPMSFLFQRTTNAVSQTAKDQSNEEGLAPLIRWKSDLLTRCVRVGWGWDDIEAKTEFEQEQDAKTAADIHKIYIDEGVLTRNEVRADLGKVPMEGGDVVTITSPGGAVIPLSQAINPPPPPAAPASPGAEPGAEDGGGNEPGEQVSKLKKKSISRGPSPAAPRLLKRRALSMAY